MFDRMSNVDTDAELRSRVTYWEACKIMRKNLKVGSRTILILTLGKSSEDPDYLRVLIEGYEEDAEDELEWEALENPS